jgi:hypothetical protein
VVGNPAINNLPSRGGRKGIGVAANSTPHLSYTENIDLNADLNPSTQEVGNHPKPINFINRLTVTSSSLTGNMKGIDTRGFMGNL